MSWDVLVARFPPTAQSAEDLNDWDPTDFTTPRTVIEACRAIDPDTRVSDNGIVDFGPYQLQFDDLDEPTGVISLSGYADLAGGVDLLLALVERLDARAFDPQIGEFIDAATAGSSMEAWMRYRDRVIGSGGTPDS